MTFTLKQETIDNYYIEIKQDKYSDCYAVELLEMYGGEWHRKNINYYTTWQKAVARFNRVRRTINAK